MISRRSGFVAALSIVVALLACGSETDPRSDAASLEALVGLAPGSPNHPRLEVYGCDIGAGWANVCVRQEGVPVNDASVSVNGQDLPRFLSEDGAYSGSLPSRLAAGEKVFLEVTRGRSTVFGRGTIPGSPVLTSPAAGTTLASSEDIVVTWTSPSEPDYFTVWAQWSCGAGCGTGKSFDAARTARTLTIPASSLPSGQDVVLTVFAYNDGKLHRNYAPYAPYPGMNIRAESNQVDVLRSTHPLLEVYGRDMSAMWENVSVLREGSPVTDALVSVNDQVIPLLSEDNYHGSLPALLAPGETLHLKVTSGVSTVTGVGTVPDAPVLTSPPTDSTFAPGEDVVVTWTSPSEPDYFTVWAQWSCGATCGTGKSYDAAHTARAVTIPSGDLPAGQPIVLGVFAYNDGTLSGDYTPHLWYPGMNIRAESNQVTVSY
jgi:hypothetical protein